MRKFFKDLATGCFVVGLGYLSLLSFWMLTLMVAEKVIPFVYPHYYVAIAMAFGLTIPLAYLVGWYLNRND